MLHPSFTLFPYTTLFRSYREQLADNVGNQGTSAVSNIAKVDNNPPANRSEEHTSELQSLKHLVCSFLLGKQTDRFTHNNTVNHSASGTASLGTDPHILNA